MWARSFRSAESIERTTLDASNQHGSTIGIQCMNGRICIWRERDDIAPPPASPFMLVGWKHYSGVDSFQRFPSGLHWLSVGYDHEPRRLVVPGQQRIWSER